MSYNIINLIVNDNVKQINMHQRHYKHIEAHLRCELVSKSVANIVKYNVKYKITIYMFNNAYKSLLYIIESIVNIQVCTAYIFKCYFI